MSARSRKPIGVVTSILSRSCRASSGASTGVLPFFTLCLGPRTAVAGLKGMTPPVASQSNIIRTAARRCFTVGAGCSCCICSTQAATTKEFTCVISRRPRASSQAQKSPTARP